MSHSLENRTTMIEPPTASRHHTEDNSEPEGACGDCLHHPPAKDGSPLESPGAVFDAVFLLMALGLLVFSIVRGVDGLVGDLSIRFIATLCEAMPFMLFGSLVGGLIEEFVPEDFLGRALQRNEIAGILLFGAAGMVFPVCECAIVPVAARLIRKGAPLSAAVAFLLGVPVVNPVVGFSTALAYGFDWNVVAVRMGFGYLIAVSCAFLIGRWFKDGREAVLPAHASEHTDCCSHGVSHDTAPGSVALPYRSFAATGHACHDFFEAGRYLFFGAFVAALAGTLVSVDLAGRFMASPFASILGMMFLAVGLNLCSEADAFIAAGFSGIVPGSAQMAFMLLGPVLDVKLLLMYRTVFHRRLIVMLALLTFMAVPVCALTAHYTLGGLLHGR